MYVCTRIIVLVSVHMHYYSLLFIFSNVKDQAKFLTLSLNDSVRTTNEVFNCYQYKCTINYSFSSLVKFKIKLNFLLFTRRPRNGRIDYLIIS
jgi:hypothetical protein